MGIPKAYGGYQALIDDPDVQVVHNCTPNYLHLPVNLAVIEKQKHIVSDKPLAMNAGEAKQLLDAVTQAGVVHAVTFNYRGNPQVQQARAMIAKGEIGRVHFIHGHYLQDWLIKETDFSWRDRAGEGRTDLRDGGHRLALVRSRAARERPAHRSGPGRSDHRHQDAEEAGRGPGRPSRRRRSTRGSRGSHSA